MTVSDDAPLVAAAAGGDTTAFNRLVLRYQDQAYTLCYRLTGNTDDAADATQEAFLSAYRHISEARGSFRAWLLRIASNCCYDLHRQRRRRPTESLDAPAAGDDDAPPGAQLADPAIGPEGQAIQAETERAVQAALIQLPEDQRLAVVLCDLYGFDYQAIADMTEVELGTVKSRINRGRRRLRDALLAVRELLPPQYRLREA